MNEKSNAIRADEVSEQDSALSRRQFVAAGLAATGAVYLGGVEALLNAVSAQAAQRESPLLGFKGIPVSTADTVTVPEGYSAKVLIAWGDPVSDGPAFRPDASNTAAEQARQWGMHNDGLAYFPIEGSRRGLLVQNNEYVDVRLLFPDGPADWTAEKSRKVLAAHGVSIVEIRRDDRGEWRVVRPSKFARRITGETPMNISGPVAGHPRMITKNDPSGRRVLGTLNNCAIGVTPWGTLLTCEENFNDYFVAAPNPGPLEVRYGISPHGALYFVHQTESRFRLADEPNEANRFGWVVEIDPFKPQSTPAKRTALGRAKHENAKVQETSDGRIVVYTGDDEEFEYIYRFVSRLRWRDALRRGRSPLDDGVLYAAKFRDDGAGEWLPLTPSNRALKGWTLAEILVNTRGAADAVGATKMDRPEWIETLPETRTVLATLTNNTSRGATGKPGPDAANPRANNVYGQIIRWTYAKDWTDNHFRWDLFALCGDPADPATGSTIVGDKYGSPDGLYVAPSGRLWIQCDATRTSINRGPYAGFGNNQMLCADPRTRETRRFLTGPNQCEVASAWVTPDETSMFVGIQHPGESPIRLNDPQDPKRHSSWPDGDAGGRPRSACIVITKDDGGKIGS